MRRGRRQSWGPAAAVVLTLGLALCGGPAWGYFPPVPPPGYADEVFFYQTTDYLLAYSATANAWYPLAIEGQELIRGVRFSGSVIVVATSERMLGFSSQTNRWEVLEAVPSEEFLEVFVRDNVGVVRTSRRLLGFSALSGLWSELDLNYTGGGGY